jgi:hypothetical protein|tara:strand:- start:840 stop:1652 length:813 start_codon:yes stop_codon:yes gene_type:complete
LATVNIGSLTFTHKGDYASGTAYVKNDVVYYSTNGSAYIAKQATQGNAPTSTAHWNVFVQKGTNGTDADLASISGTVQGDIYYNNGSAIARLAPGTANQILKTGGSGANPSWTNAPVGGVLQSVIGNNNGYNQSTTSQSLVDVESASGTTWETSITPSSSSSKILLLPAFQIRSNASSTSEGRYTWNISRKIASGSYSIIWNMYEAGAYDRGGHGVIEHSVHSPAYIDLPNTTSAVTYKFQVSSNGQELAIGWGGSPTPKSYLTLLELGV